MGIFFDPPQKSWPTQKLRPTQNILTHAENFDPRKNFDPRNPRKNYDPRKKYFDPRNPGNPRKSLTHATHAPTWLRLPRNPRDLADLWNRRVCPGLLVSHDFWRQIFAHAFFLIYTVVQKLYSKK